MVELIGENLGKRQQELNTKVAETVKKKIDFVDIMEAEESSDIDKLFKIDVASKYKNFDYIVEILKCGDSLYVSRALKCDWIYNDEYSHIINPDYLHHEIFPYMSLKMKNKMINKIASQIRNESRAAAFFTYYQNLKMEHFAVKYLYSTSETFKLDLINSGFEIEKQDFNLKHFIGTSFVLAEAFISKVQLSYNREYHLMRLSYLYSVNHELYLNLLENNVTTNSGKLFGGRMSKSIITKHKDRVLKSPLLYVHKLNKYTLVRHSSIEDAKKYIVALLPRELKEFWKQNLYKTYKHVFNIIPINEVFNFLKNTFKSLYGDKPFEMTFEFYEYQYYELLTLEEREKWALKHIEEGKELLGSNKDFVWYKFVNFEQALHAIRQYILVTSDEDLRNEMVVVLIYSCRNQRDLEKLFNYYYDRHVNECGHHKEDFIDNVLTNHNVFKFDEQCWAIFNKILYSMEVYTPGFYGKNHYRAFCVIYYILHKIDLPDALTYYIDSDIDYYLLKRYSKKITEEEWFDVYQYLFNYYLNKFQTINDENKKVLKQKKIDFTMKLIDLLEAFEKKKEDIPEVVFEFVKENLNKFLYIKMFNEKIITEASLVRLLKKDKNEVVKKLPELKEQLDNDRIKLTSLLKKIKIYFYKDIAKDFLKFFQKNIANKSGLYKWNTKMAIYGIFILGDQDCKNKLLIQYAPEEPKIDYSKIDKNLLEIQEVICRLACYSRPPVPLNSISHYIKGDYVHYCLPMFNNYLVNLPLPQSINFIKSILDAPVSIQKHGIRLAFHAYSIENLKLLIEDVWKRTKNVSLRMIIYKALVNKIKNSNKITQNELCNTLKMFTLTLHGDDQDDIFKLIVSNEIPESLRGNLLETAWLSIKKLPHKKSKNVTIKTDLIKRIEDCINLMNREYCKNHIIQENVDCMLSKQGIKQTMSPVEQKFNDALWELTAKYLITYKEQNELEDTLLLVNLIFQEIFKQWNYVSEGNVYIIAKFCYDFVDWVEQKSCEYNYRDKVNVIPVMERILKLIQEFSPVHDVFTLILNVKIFIAIKRILNKKSSNNMEVAELIGKSLVIILGELKNNNQLSLCLFGTISKFILNSIYRMTFEPGLNGDILIGYLCNNLVSTKNIYFALLAIYLMPLKPVYTTTNENLSLEIFKDFQEKVKEINNFEVQSYYYKKFVVDCQFRKRV